MSPGDDELGNLEVVDADGDRIGTVEAKTRAELARHLFVQLDEDAQEALDVDDETLDLPTALIGRLTTESVELNRNLRQIKETLEGLDPAALEE